MNREEEGKKEKEKNPCQCLNQSHWLQIILPHYIACCLEVSVMLFQQFNECGSGREPRDPGICTTVCAEGSRTSAESLRMCSLMVVMHQWSQSQAPTGATDPDVDGTAMGGCKSPGVGWWCPGSQRACAVGGSLLLSKGAPRKVQQTGHIKEELNWVKSK